MNENFTLWLSSGETGPCQIRSKGFTYNLIRVKKNAVFDYLYAKRSYQNAGLTRGDFFEYVGIYYKRDGLLYDGQYDLRDICDEAAIAHGTAKALQERLQACVRRMVEAAVGNDRRNLKVSTLNSQQNLQRFECFLKYTAKENARAIYLNGDELSLVFRCHYEPERWSEESLLDYITDPDGYAEKEAVAYMTENQEDMLSEFLENDAVSAEYEALLSDRQNPIHRVKKIRNAVIAASPKTVNVTIFKDGVEFIFKTEADGLRRDCTSYYSSYAILAADRRKFERQFGRNAEYTPVEIRRITYGRAVLYEAAE